jgi:hypothetical protein
MSQINDLKKVALTALGFTGALNDQELAFYRNKGATESQHNAAKQQWLSIKGFATGSLNDREYAYCGGTGTLNDRIVARLIAGTYYA